MTFELFLKGILLGILNAAPVGPVGLLCLRRNLIPDRWHGMFAGMGMAVAYGVISFLVVFGLKSISGFLLQFESALRIGGGTLLIAMGWRGLRPAGRTEIPGFPAPARYLAEFSASLMMTLCNPVPFASFAVILTSFHLFKAQPGLPVDLVFAASVMTGTLIFWGIVNEILHHVKKRSTESLSRGIGRAVSGFLVVLGFVVAAKGIF